MVYRSIMIIPCPLEQSIDESTFFKPWKSLPLLFASNSGLVNSRSYNVWKSSTVFHCHLFLTGIQVFKLFVRGDKQNPIGFKGERTLRGKMIQNVGSNCGQAIMTKITWSTAEMGTNWIMNVYLESSFRDLRVLFSLQWTLSHFGNGILFHSLTLARCLLLVCCLVTRKPNKLIVLWSSVFWWFCLCFRMLSSYPFQFKKSTVASNFGRWRIFGLLEAAHKIGYPGEDVCTFANENLESHQIASKCEHL